MIQFFALLCLMVVCYVFLIRVFNQLIVFLTKRNMLDKPSNRRMHNDAVPRGAGIALVLLFPLYFFLSSKIYALDITQHVLLILALVMVSGISWMDDVKERSAAIRVAVHLCASFIALKTYLLLPDISFLLVVVCAVGLAGFANIYNFLDGIDGITAIETLHLSAFIMLVTWIKSDIIQDYSLLITLSSLCFVFSAAFLRFNLHPAKLFLGDVGSISLGFIIGYCLIMLFLADYYLIIPIGIATLYYLADGAGTLCIRLLKREKFWLPHLNHFFQKAMQNGMEPPAVIRKIINCNLILLALSVSSLYYPVFSILFALAVVGITIILLTQKIV